MQIKYKSGEEWEAQVMYCSLVSAYTSCVIWAGSGFLRLNFLTIKIIDTSLVVQWVSLHAPNAGGPGSTPGRGTRSHMHATAKTWHSLNK